MNHSEKTGIDLLANKRIWSESVYADCVSSDGKRAIMTRLCRYPEQSTSWLWVFFFVPEGIYGYNNNYLHCHNKISDVEGQDLEYAHMRQEKAIFKRSGPRDSPHGALVSIELKLHKGSKVPQEDGNIKIQLKTELTPKLKPWRMNKYRTEWINHAKTVLIIEKTDISFEGFGHWHEQYQKAPRWKTPFTYITLRGENLSLIGSSTEPNDAGFAVYLSKKKKIQNIQIEPPGVKRNIRIELEDSTILKGKINTIYFYLVPIYSRWRPGTVVTAVIDGESLTGCVNDWIIKNN
ncbi:MAG: hypothetical protein ACFFDB_01695 [Promethearchaeota archaeon]